MKLHCRVRDGAIKDLTTQCASKKCPIAEAINRALTLAGFDGHYASVGPGDVNIYTRDHVQVGKSIKLSEKVAKFITDFDGELARVKPIKFTVEVEL